MIGKQNLPNFGYKGLSGLIPANHILKKTNKIIC